MYEQNIYFLFNKAGFLVTYYVGDISGSLISKLKLG